MPGADQIADKLLELTKQQKLSVDIVRNGSRGLFWLEPAGELNPSGVIMLWGCYWGSDSLSKP